jgi:hypothetical protein
MLYSSAKASMMSSIWLMATSMAALSFVFLTRLSSFSFAHCLSLLGAGLMRALDFTAGSELEDTVMSERKKRPV